MDGACRFPLDVIFSFGVGSIIDLEVTEGDVTCDEAILVSLSELTEEFEGSLANRDFALPILQGDGVLGLSEL